MTRRIAIHMSKVPCTVSKNTNTMAGSALVRANYYGAIIAFAIVSDFGQIFGFKSGKRDFCLAYFFFAKRKGAFSFGICNRTKILFVLASFNGNSSTFHWIMVAILNDKSCFAVRVFKRNKNYQKT